jgi:hypothetical protein
MFKAIVLACQIANPEICTEISDETFRYKTFGECALRAEAIKNAIPSALTGFKAVAWRCDKRPSKLIKGVDA